MKIEKSNQLAECEIVYKTKVKMSEQPKITDSVEVNNILKGVYNPDRIDHIEMMVLLMFNRNNRLLGWAKISTGGVSSAICDPKVVFQLALNANASGIVLSHNHPSGDITPSKEDKNVTNRIKEGAKILDITLLDHLIVNSDGEYYSFRDNNLM